MIRFIIGLLETIFSLIVVVYSVVIGVKLLLHGDYYHSAVVLILGQLLSWIVAGIGEYRNRN